MIRVSFKSKTGFLNIISRVEPELRHSDIERLLLVRADVQSRRVEIHFIELPVHVG